MEKYKFKIYRAAAIAIGIMIAFVLLELGLRVYKAGKYSTQTIRISQIPALVYEHKPSVAFANRHGINIRYNSLGFIGEEVGPKQKGVFRILGIGDSITAGEYLPEEQRYLNRTAAILAEKTQKRIEVINAAVTGYNTWQELALLQTKGLSLKPDFIIVGVCLNDDCGWRPELKKTWFGRLRALPRHHKKARYFNFLYQRSKLYEFLYDWLYWAKRLCKKGAKYFDEYESFGVDGHTPNFEVWKKPLNEMVQLAKAHKIKIFFVIFPFEQQVLRGEQVSFSPLVDFFKSEDIYFLDLIKYLESSRKGELYLKRDPVHLNTLGAEMASQAIAGYIMENAMVEK